MHNERELAQVYVALVDAECDRKAVRIGRTILWGIIAMFLIVALGAYFEGYAKQMEIMHMEGNQ